MRGKTKSSEFAHEHVLGYAAIYAAVAALAVGGVVYWLGGTLTAVGAASLAIGGLTLVGMWLLSYWVVDDCAEGDVDDEGYRHGVWIWRWPDGEQSQVTYRHGDRHGRCVKWYANGELAEDGHYRAGKLHGTVRVWEEKGQLAKQHCFCEGKLHGRHQTWHANGQLATDIQAENGSWQGPARGWHANGRQSFEGNYESGYRHGLWSWWHANGERWVSGGYLHGTMHGCWEELDENGVRVCKTQFVAGLRRGSGKRFFMDRTDSDGFLDPALPRPSQNRGPIWWLVVGAVLVAVTREPFLLVLLVGLMLAIFVHELGHLLVAKLVGIPIERVRIGIGPPLFSFLCCGTIFELHLLPILGFVEPYQMRRAEWEFARAALRSCRRGTADADYADFVPDETPCHPSDEFVSPLPRQLFLLGGVAMNFLAACTLLWALHAMDADSFGVERVGPLDSVVKTAELAVRLMCELPQRLIQSVSGADEHQQGGFALLMRDGAYKSVNQGSLLLEIAFGINMLLLCFNLLPIPPLDGYRCVASVVEVIVGREFARMVLWPVELLGIAVAGLLVLREWYLFSCGVMTMILGG